MMVDNLGKNMMLDTWDNKIFMPRFYDCDTICSYDNSGQLKFAVDIEMAQGYWNTSSSRLWTRIRDLMHDELVAKYNNMRQNGLSYESLMECFYDEQIAKIPQKYYNQDYDVKYAPFADSYIGMANGDTYEHLKRWLQQRLRFVDTLYDYAPSYNNDVLTIRANTTEPMTLEIETYTPVYQHLSWYNNQMDKKKIDGKTSVTFTGKAMAETDQEVLIYGGSNIKSIKGISSMNPNRMLIGSATRLIELDAPNCPLLADINANKANLAPHVYLNKVNLSGCPLLGGNLIINQSPLVREIDIRNTAITGLNLPSNLRNLETLKLPATIPNLILNDASQLHTLEYEEGGILQNVSMTNCNALTNVTNFDLSNAQQVTLNNSYNAINELYLKNASTLSLSNMNNLEKVIYTPNAEHETFDITNLANTKDYNITTFNCPKLNTFMTTAPYRESYNNVEYKEGLVLKPTLLTEIVENISFNNGYYINYLDGKYLSLKNGIYATETFIPITSGNNTFYFSGEFTSIQIVLYDENKNYISIKNETYFSNIKKVPFEFQVSEKYKYFRFSINCEGMDAPNINDFKITEWTLCELKDYGEIKPNEVFEANTIDISNTQFTDVKLLCTTDTNVLKLPQTVKNLVVDSAYDLDTAYLTDGDYDTIHAELYEPYNTDYENNVTPTNIVPSASDGSLIFSMYAPHNTTEPTSGTWDLKGLELEEYHTFGLNNDVKLVDNTLTMPDRYDEYSLSIKNKTVKNEVARYTASDLNTLPTFNSEFTYTYNITKLDEVYEYSIIADSMDNLPTQISFNGKTSLLTVEYLNTSNVTNMSNMFNGCNNLTSLDVSNFDTSNVTNMYKMFNGCGKLTELDVSKFDTSEVTTMSQMFYSCQSLTSLDVSNFDTSKVTDMSVMFAYCYKLTSLDLSRFDTSNVTTMYQMFYYCTNLTSLDVSNFDTKNVTNMSWMFTNCSQLTSLDSMMNISTSLSLSSTKLDTSSLLDVIDNLATVTTTQTLTLGTTLLAKLTEEQIAVAVNKGWTVE